MSKVAPAPAGFGSAQPAGDGIVLFFLLSYTLPERSRREHTRMQVSSSAAQRIMTAQTGL
ncbi:MAG: hypothetical protein LAT84_11470 [Balneolia bacterium]|nr:hypothetical protein [Balneolia bacterium]